jgi:hypothetical protein
MKFCYSEGLDLTMLVVFLFCCRGLKESFHTALKVLVCASFSLDNMGAKGAMLLLIIDMRRIALSFSLILL